MTSIAAWIKKTIDSEPARAYLDTAIVLGMGFLVTKGLVTGSEADIVEGVVGAVLGAGTTELVRSKVTPVAAAVAPVLQLATTVAEDVAKAVPAVAPVANEVAAVATDVAKTVEAVTTPPAV